MNIWIKGGHLLDPVTDRDGMFDVYIKDNLIHKVVAPGEVVEGIAVDQIIEASGKHIMPGFIDLHVHLREPGLTHKETIATGTMAAARGGFTAVCPMPNTVPSTDCPEMIETVLQINEKEGHVRLYPVGAVTMGQNGQEITDIKAMKAAGVKAISEDGKSVMNTQTYLEAMKIAGKEDVLVMAHCEDRDLVNGGVINAGDKAEELSLPGISNAVEDVITARDILLAKEAKVALHLCHCSTKDSVEMIRISKQNGLKVTGEVCPHHFVLCDQDIPSDDADYKMNPPLRSKEDVQALKIGLQDGTMDVIATDHAPHSQEEKSQSMATAPFGIVGLETAFSLSVTHLVREGYLTRKELVEKLSSNPAGILGVEGGSLEVGRAADLVIADFDACYTIDRSKFASKGKNTPFHGKEVYGKIEKTLVNGIVVYDSEKE